MTCRGRTVLLLEALLLLGGCGRHPARLAHPGLDPRYAPVIARFRDEIPGLMQKHRLPGLALALVDRRGILWSQGFGVTDEGGAAVTPDTPFSVQSTSKPFTAVAVLLAVQAGLLDLDRPLARYLPELEVQSRFDQRPLEKITLRHLLSHTAGFTHEAPVGNNFEPCDCFEAHWRSIARTWLRYPVGDRFAYSNLGIDLAGAVLERASGKPFARFLEERLLLPLGMRDSSFDLGRIRARRDRAVGHRRGHERVPLEIPMVPSGGLYASARDMARFLVFQLNQGRPSGVAAPLLEERWLLEMQRIPFPSPGQHEGYALGIGREVRRGRLLFHHGGGGFGFLCDLMWYPEPGLGLVILTNSADHPLQGELAHRILDVALAVHPTVTAPAAPSLPAELPGLRAAAPWLGSYLGRAGRVELALRAEGRAALVGGGQSVALRFVDEDQALSVRPGGEVRHYRFLRHSDGRPRAILQVEGGGLLDYNDSARDAPGPDRPEWQRYLGEYQVRRWGQPLAKLRLERRNGYLYFDGARLLEHAPGLFFSADGEALDLRGSPSRAGSIPLEKLPASD